MNRLPPVAALLALASSALTACEAEAPLLEVYELPSELGALDVRYIAFEYGDSGHVHHTPLLAMELAVQGIPSVPVEVDDCGDDGLEAPNGVEWSYHSAIGIERDGEIAVVDPILSAELLGLDEFRRAFHDASSRVTVGPSNASGVQRCENRIIERVPARVEDMPPFDFENVMIHCAYMRRFYRDIGGDYEAREQRLFERVRELTLALHELGLVGVQMGDPEFELLQQEPYCPLPIPRH